MRGGLLYLDFLFCTSPGSDADPVYQIAGPITLGAGIIPAVDPLLPSSNGGISLGVGYYDGSDQQFTIDRAYASVASISSRSTFSGITLASLGMPTPGILATWMLVDPNDSSYVGDTISVQVTASSSGSPANVPGPLPLLGLGVAFGFSRRLRRRVRLRSKTSQPS